MDTPLRILYLEDDATDAELVQATLEEGGIASKITRVETQAAFCAALEQDGFDLVLADYTLPSFDGLTALRIAVEKRPEVPFIFLSGTLSEDVAIEALKIGASDYVFKTRLSRIVPSVRRALREGRERAERKCAREALRRSEAYLAEAQRLSHTGSFGWDVVNGEIYWSQETFRIFEYEPASKVTIEQVVQRTHPEDKAAVQELIERVSREREDFDFEHRLLMPDGSVRYVRVVGHPSTDQSGSFEFVGAVTDITERKHAEALFTGEKRLLEMIATGVALKEILKVLCLIIEEQRSVTFASVLLLRPDGLHLESVAGPSLPKEWRQEMESQPIGPCAGSCGTAAYRGTPVIVSDIATDPLWDVPEHRAAALKHGLRASWSNPVLSSEGKVLGTFCMYYRETRSPTPHDLELIELATHVARVAIERDRAEAALRRSEGFLAEGQRISHTGSWSWDVASGNVTWSEEHFRIFGVDPEIAPNYQLFLQTVHPDDRARIERDLDDAVGVQREFDMEFRIALADGTIKHVQGVGRPVLTEAGEVRHYIGTTVDITARKSAEALLAGEKRLLEMVARGDRLPCILDALCQLVEELSSGALSSILLLDANGKSLRHGAGPNLPKAYIDAIDGATIGPSAGSCGTAAYRGQPVIVSDIATDRLWVDYRDLALRHGLRACWSSPILSSEDNVLGTFAIYYRDPRSPTPQQLEIIEQITHLACIALERQRAEAALRASEQLARGQVEALVQSLDVLATAPAPDQFILRMLSTMGRLLGGQWVALWLLDEATDALVLRAAVKGENSDPDDSGHPFVKDPFAWKDDLGLQELFFTGVPVTYEDVDTDPRIPSELRAYFQSQGTRKFLRLPTLVGGEVKGFITIRHAERPPYQSTEIELAQALAHQAMLAIQSRQAATLEERNRMARDIHDTLAQGFTAIVVQLQAAEDANSKGLKREAEKHLQTARDLARQSLTEARRSVQALRPQALEDRPFWDALKGMIKQSSAGTALRTKFQVRGQPRELPPLWQENLLHIGQEALTNTLKYARAARFEARLSFNKTEVRLEFEDDGEGFTTTDRHDGFGLTGMRERVEQMGGALSLTSARGKGTKIVVVSPYTLGVTS